MATINFPDSPQINDEFSFDARIWRWDGIAWRLITSAHGPTGPQGAPGVDGVTGPTGPQGSIGSDGPTGPQGLEGPIGPTGPMGDTGPQGNLGPTGPQGTPGIDGADGLQGLQGDAGPIGPTGPAGADGINGAPGDIGATGPTGNAGPTGPAGADGADGSSGVVSVTGNIINTGTASAAIIGIADENYAKLISGAVEQTFLGPNIFSSPYGDNETAIAVEGQQDQTDPLQTWHLYGKNFITTQIKSDGSIQSDVRDDNYFGEHKLGYSNSSSSYGEARISATYGAMLSSGNDYIGGGELVVNPSSIYFRQASDDWSMSKSLELSKTEIIAHRPTKVYAPSNTVGLLVHGASGQTENLQNWADDSDTVLASVSPTGDFTAGSIAKTGGTSGQFLKADGSVDSTAYAGLASPTFSGTVNVNGDLYVSGTTTTVNTQEIVVTDPIVYIGEGNTSNITDLGFVASFDNGTYQHSGLIRDASDNKWKLFSGVTDEPGTTVNFAQAVPDTLVIGTLETDNLVVDTAVNFTGATITGLDLLPSQTGNSGKYLTTNGTVASWATLNATPAFNDLSDVTITSPATNDVAYFDGSGWINKNLASIPVSINSQAAGSYTAVLADAGKIVEISNATAALFKIPEDADVDYPIGTQIQILQAGVGQVSIVAKTPGSTTVNYTPGNSLRAQWSAATVTKRAANTWVLIGDLA